MTQKPSSNGQSLPTAPREKKAFIHFIERLLNLQPDCSVIDLDISSNIQILPTADIGIWLDSWHNYVDGLGSREDAQVGIEAAQDLLYLISCRLPNLIFSADNTKPPLDQFGHSPAVLSMLFKESTCYQTITAIATYKGRTVYWGSNPSRTWTEMEGKNLRLLRRGF